MEAFNFTAASEDCNLYTYDMRKLQTAACVHKVSHWQTTLSTEGLVWRVPTLALVCHRLGAAVLLCQLAGMPSACVQRWGRPECLECTLCSQSDWC